MKTLRNCLIVLLSFSVIGSTFLIHSVQGIADVTIEPASVSFSMTSTDRDTKAVVLSNHTAQPIQFAVVKQSSSTPNSNEHCLKTDEVPSEEVGSPWVTPQYDYARTGYNKIESTSPPFEQKWRSTYNKAVMPPVLSGNNLYLPSEDGRIHHIHSRTGVKEDSYHIGEAIYSVHLYTRYLLVATNKNLVLFDRIAKQVIWTKPYFVPSLYGIAAWEGLLFIGTQSNLICLDLITGREVWYRQGKCDFIATNEGILTAVLNQTNLWVGRCQTGIEVYSMTTNHPIPGSPVMDDQNIYYCTTDEDNSQSTVVCFSLDGKEQWKHSLDDYITSSMAVDEQYVFFSTGAGRVVALDQSTGHIKWEKNIGTTILIPPIVAWNTVYFGGNDGNIYCFDRNNGADIWIHQMSFPINSPLVMAQGFLYVEDNSGNMFAFCRVGENVIPPFAPARLKGYPGPQKFILSWDIEQPKPDLAGFHIYRKKEFEREFSFIDTTGIVNYYVDEPLENGVTYRYIVRAFDTYGNESTNSNMVTGIPSQSLTPVWLDYQPTSGSILPQDSVILTVKADGTLVPPGEYKAELLVLFSGIEKDHTKIQIPVSMKTSKGDPSILQPPSLQRITGSDTRATLYWKKYPGIWSMEVFRSTVSGDEMILIDTLHGQEVVYVDDTVKNGIEYYYTLKAVTQDGIYSDFSNELSIVPRPSALQIYKDTTSTVFHPVFEIQGRADPKATLFVQDQPIPLAPSGEFVTSVGVPAGISKLMFKAIATDKTIQEEEIEVNCIAESYTIRLQIQNQQVYVNDLLWPWDLEAPPLLQSQRTFVPLRFISEIVGGTVQWDPQEKRIQVLYKQNEVVLWIGKREILVNGKTAEIDAAPFILNNRTLVPLRFVTEPLGATIEWDGATQTILLYFYFT
jgi:outer membrane protein assembly factor BamB/fibronectin type 3 domain-containing protein